MLLDYKFYWKNISKLTFKRSFGNLGISIVIEIGIGIGIEFLFFFGFRSFFEKIEHFCSFLCLVMHQYHFAGNTYFSKIPIHSSKGVL